MDNIGSLFKQTRESSGVSIKEASIDLSIDENYLLNIEEGKIGCFKDIYALKEYLINYAKYLGLDADRLVDKFNEYMFEYTSKIPVKEIEKQAQAKKKEEARKIASPYTRPRKYSKNYYITVYLIIVILVIVAILWSIKQITINNSITNEISYVKFTH